MPAGLTFLCGLKHRSGSIDSRQMLYFVKHQHVLRISLIPVVDSDVAGRCSKSNLKERHAIPDQAEVADHGG